MPHLYNEFYAYLEDEFEKNGLGMQTTKPKNGMFMFLAHCSITQLLFFVLLSGFEPLKPFVVKLQKRNQGIFKGYYTIDIIDSDLMDYRRNVDKEFSNWYGFFVETTNSIGLESSSLA